ncbi:helix-turn-helix domain-containing protein [Candidatus Palauibacter sp.]|uniref:helix-turn-helix domain-containing protein n=1 Tax=Candidatus Palauibacter sp. TaxID=3101350 RepID=UPI003CC6381E
MTTIRTRIFELGITQERVARTVGYDPSLFSRILNGLRPTPDGFEERVHATLDRLEAAERAAEKARRRVLEGDGPKEAVGAPGPKEAA